MKQGTDSASKKKIVALKSLLAKGTTFLGGLALLFVEQPPHLLLKKL